MFDLAENLLLKLFLNMTTRFLLFLFIVPVFLPAQELLPVADQTLKLSGEHEYVFAFAEGDQIELHVALLEGKQIKAVELVQYPEYPVFRTYELDSVIDKSIRIPKTGVYLFRLNESGFGKKVCRFTLHRRPAGTATTRFDTRVTWDIRQYPMFRERKRQTQTGTRTEVVSSTGKVTVEAAQLGMGKNRNSYQFTLPPNTVRWAYRIAVGQEVAEARKKDSQKLSEMLQRGAIKVAGFQPETALAAFALGMAIDLTTSTAGEDVEYALVNAANQQRFLKGEEYKAEIWQGGISVDVQRRYKPLEGSWFFAFKNSNWIDAIDVNIDIEAVTEVPVFSEEIYLEPVRP
ncbi:MAG: hypothetical protein RL742_824 [Bacteroidota bacterium]